MLSSEISDLVYIDDRPAFERLARLREYRQELMRIGTGCGEERDMLLSEVNRAIARLSTTAQRPDIPFPLGSAQSAVRALRA